MSNEDFASQKPDELLAEQMGDPAGPPQPIGEKDPVLRILAGVGIGLAVVAGGILLPAIACPQRTAGASRSVKIRWEHRQQEIDQVQALHESQSHE
jgi:hypothetical protein